MKTELVILSSDWPEHLQMKTFGQALKKVRMARKMSYKEVADRVGTARSTVHRWENSTTVPSNLHLKKLYGTFPNLRFFTYLLPSFDKERFLDRASVVQAISKEDFAKQEDSFWLPPIALITEAVPSELLNEGPALSFGEFLRETRLAEGLSEEELAQLLDVRNQTVSQWELEKAVPIIAHYEKLCELMPALKNGPIPPSLDISKPGPPQGTEQEVSSPARGPYLLEEPKIIVAKEESVLNPVSFDQSLAEAGILYAQALRKLQQDKALVARLTRELKEATHQVKLSEEKSAEFHLRLSEIATGDSQ